ncbi:MAG: efflux RND transporter periplasmic adaptor subunit [Candidatus Omnitrophica bacterium]|nr:efflux RND transporter periplasmic adaptor subunit [Candidatus Omnitrophota bacterium]
MPEDTFSVLPPEPLPPAKPKRGKILAWALIILMAGASAYFTRDYYLPKLFPAKADREKPPTAEKAPKEEPKVPIKTFKVGRFNYEDSLNALGTIKGAIEFKLSFEIPGVINSINYREGERYEEGALLVSLKQDDVLLRLQKSQAQLKKAETSVALAKEKLNEHEKLFEIGAIPKTTLDKVKLEVESAEYDLEAAQLEVKANESVLEKSNLYAPTDGMIGELLVEEGENITPNTLLGSHVQVDYVEAEFGIVERDVSRIQLGLKARIYVDAYPDKVFEGVVDNIQPIVTGTSRTATARIRIENPEGQLLPGMFARIRIVLFSKQNTIVVPTEAVQGGEDDTWIFAVDEVTELISKRPIQVGYERPDYVQVDVGLEEGELVAMSGFDRLEEGTKVRVIEKQEAEL